MFSNYTSFLMDDPQQERYTFREYSQFSFLNFLSLHPMQRARFGGRIGAGEAAKDHVWAAAGGDFSGLRANIE
jgi:hypothetical protein